MSFFHFVIPALAIILSACTVSEKTAENPGSLRAGPDSLSTHTWHLGSYQVRFAAGPHQRMSDGATQSFSTYSVMYKKDGQAPVTEVALSGMDIENFVYDPGLKATDFAKVFVSPSEKYLLISEDVPNDGGPCSNFILFELVGEKFRTSYLKMPTQRPSAKTGQLVMIYNTPPSIRDITDEEIKFSHFGKKAESLPIQEIPKAAGVMLP